MAENLPNLVALMGSSLSAIKILSLSHYGNLS
jgi:hypothetical protein